MMVRVEIKGKDGSKEGKEGIVSGHLSTEVRLWGVLKNSFGQLTGLQMYNKINISTIPLSIATIPLTSSLSESCTIMIAGKDSKIRTVQLSTTKSIITK